MPPMITDDDASGTSSGAEDIIPPKKSAKASAKTTKKPAKSVKPAVEVEDDVEDEAVADDNDDDDQDEDDEIGEDEYIVERILGHDWENDGTLKYHIKWSGYDNPEDETWEPEENLEGAAVAIEEYHKKIGGKPVFIAKGRGRGKRKSQATETTPDIEASNKGKKRKTNGTADSAKKTGALQEFKLPPGSWEDDVESIQTIEEKIVTGKNGKPSSELIIFMQWNDGRQFEHSASVVRQKCPQKLLDYLLSKLYVQGKKVEYHDRISNFIQRF